MAVLGAQGRKEKRGAGAEDPAGLDGLAQDVRREVGVGLEGDARARERERE